MGVGGAKVIRPTRLESRSVYGVQCTAYITHIIGCKLYGVHCMAYIAHSIGCTVYVAYIEHRALYGVQCMAYCLHYMTYNVRSTLYIVHYP